MKPAAINLSDALRIVVTILILLIPSLSFPGTADDLFDDEGMLFDDIPSVYTASKYEQKVTQAPAAISIVTADEIKKYGYQTVSDILGSLPGFFTTNDRNYELVGVRGFAPPGDYNIRILLLVDGQRLNDAVYDSAAIENSFPVDVDLIDRVEVVRGPSSSLYGSSAFFGVINVITKRGRDYAGAQVALTGASHDTRKGRLTYGSRFESGVEILLSGTYAESDGNSRLYYPEFDDPLTNNGVATDRDGERYYNLLAKISYEEFTFTAGKSSRKKFIPTGSYGTVFNDPNTYSIDGTQRVGVRYEQEYDNDIALTTQLNYSEVDYYGEWAYDYSDEGDLSYIVDNQDTGDSAWWQWELQLSKQFSDRHRLVGGTELRHITKQYQANFDEEVYLDDDRDSQVWAVFLQDEYALRENLRLNLGLRYDYYESFGGTTNPRLALIYNPVEQTTLKLLYGEAFRAPNAYELYYHDGGYSQKPSVELDPETIKTTELVVEHNFMHGLLGTASLYHYVADDLITLQTDPADDLLVFVNKDRIEADGLELALEGKWSGGWKGRISYAYQDTEDKSTGETPANSPQHLVKLNLIAPLMAEKLFAGAELQYMSESNTVKNTRAGSHVVANMNLLGRELVQGLDLSVGIDNLFDEEYAHPGGEEHLQETIAQDGRTYRLKLEYAF